MQHHFKEQLILKVGDTVEFVIYDMIIRHVVRNDANIYLRNVAGCNSQVFNVLGIDRFAFFDTHGVKVQPHTDWPAVKSLELLEQQVELVKKFISENEPLLVNFKQLFKDRGDRLFGCQGNNVSKLVRAISASVHAEKR